MGELRASDLRAVMAFLDEAWAAAGERAFTADTLRALKRLIPCDMLAYCELDRLNQRELEFVTIPPDGGAGDTGSDEQGQQYFWQIADEHPLCRHQLAYADFSAKRLSDVVTSRRLAASRVQSEWFGPAGVTAELEAGISRSPVRTRNFVLDRIGGDFSERDRMVLEMVRPHLARIHEMTELRRASSAPHADPGPHLTQRQVEILELVAEGLTNAVIAQRLWIAPGTVKKHLDNAYEKLGVSSRAAAAARVTRRPRSAA